MNKKLKIAGLLLSLVAVMALGFPVIAAAEDQPQAAEPTPTPTPTPVPESVDLTATYSKIEGLSDSSFVFEVKATYTGGTKTQLFDINVTGPSDWTFYVTPSYPTDKKIKNIQLNPIAGTEETLEVNAQPSYINMPKPGNYDITIELSNKDVKGSIKLQAIVTAQYTLDLSSATDLYSMTATAGKENVYSIIVKNTGTAPLHNIKLSSSQPDGWTISYSKDSFDTMEAGQSQTIDARITPASKAIAGDYNITLTSSSKEASSHDVTVRVTVNTPSVWGWTGVGVIALVIVGLVFAMARFSRR